MHKIIFDIKWFCISIILKEFFTSASGVTGYTMLLTGYTNEILTIFQNEIRCNQLTITCNRLHLRKNSIFIKHFSCNQLGLCVNCLPLRQWHFLTENLILTYSKFYLSIKALIHGIILILTDMIHV